MQPLEWLEVANRNFTGTVDGDLFDGVSLPAELQSGPVWPIPKGIDLGRFPVSVTEPLSELANPQSHALTVRIIVSRGAGDSFEYIGEDRQTFFVVDDKSTRAGFPYDNQSSVEAALLTCDLDGDGKQEVVTADSDGFVTALRGDGSIFWRTHLDPYLKHMDAPAYASGAVDPRYEPVLGSPAAGDLNGDGKPEIVVPGLLGHIYAFKADGTKFWPAPVTSDFSRWPGELHTRARFYTSVVLADLDHDGKREIITGAQDQQLYAWHADGSRVAGFPVFLAVNNTIADVAAGTYRPAPIAAVPAVGDLNGDGIVDIVLGTDEIDRSFFGHVFAVDGRGTRAPSGPWLRGWPVATIVAPFGLPVVGEGVSGGCTLADLDGDGTLEVIGGGFSGQGTIWNADGSHRASLVRNAAGFGRFSNTHEPLVAAWTDPLATVADVDGDGRPEIYAGALGLGSVADMSLTEKMPNAEVLPDAKHLLMGWNADGSSRDYFPRRLEGWAILTNPLIADVDGDEVPEIVAGSSGYYLHAYKNNGREPAGWPKFTGGWMFATPAVADLDGTGRASVVAAVREGQVFAWRTAGRMADAPYPQMTGTPDRAGRVETWAKRDLTADEGGGCNCRQGGASGFSATWVLVLLPFWKRLRRVSRSA